MNKTLLEELTIIDAAYLEGEVTPAQETRGKKLVSLANAAPKLMTALENALARTRSGMPIDCFEMAQAINEAKGEAL